MPDQSLDQRVGAVRRFNRAYTRRIGVLRDGFRNPLVAVARGRSRAATRQEPTAGEIAAELGFDHGYLSRILRGFHERGLITKNLPQRSAPKPVVAHSERPDRFRAARPAFTGRRRRHARAAIDHRPAAVAVLELAPQRHDGAWPDAAAVGARREGGQRVSGPPGTDVSGPFSGSRSARPRSRTDRSGRSRAGGSGSPWTRRIATSFPRRRRSAPP